MARWRRALVPVSAAWLLWHAAVVVLLPTLLWADAAASAGTTECFCTHGPDADCPMHHHPARTTRICGQALTSADSGMLRPFVDFTGVVPTVRATLAPRPAARRLSSGSPRATTVPRSPDSPPPRA